MNQIHGYISHHLKLLASLSFALLVFLVFFSVDSGQAHAVALDGIPTDILQDLVNWDAPAPGTDCVNAANGEQYAQSNPSWIYETNGAGVASADDASTPAGAIQLTAGQTISLSAINIVFLCHDAVMYQTDNATNPPQSIAYPVFSDSGSPANPADGPVNTFGNNPVYKLANPWPQVAPNGPEYLSAQTKYQYGVPSVVPATDGSIGGTPNPSTQFTNAQGGTRYWYSSNPSTPTCEAGAACFNYTAPAAGTPGTVPITIKVPEVVANYFNKCTSAGHCTTSWQCVAPPYTALNLAEYNGTLSNYCPVSTAAFVIYVNVQPPLTTIQANVYTANPDGTFDAEVSGVNFANPCVAGATVEQGQSASNPGGFPSASIVNQDPIYTIPFSPSYYYVNVPNGSPYCMRIASVPSDDPLDPTSQSIPGYDGPFTRPWDYDNPPSIPTGSTSYPSVPWPSGCPNGPFNGSNFGEHCATSSYECQTAGSYSTPKDVCGDSDNDRAVDAGLDFDYVAFKDECPPGGVPGCVPLKSPTNPPTCSLTLGLGVTTPIADVPFSVDYGVTNNAKVATLDFNADSYQVTFSPNPLGGATFSIPDGTTIPPGGGTYDTSASLTLSAGSYTETMTLEAYNIDDPGTYEVLDKCTLPITVAAAPYLKVFGGNVEAGVESTQIASCFETPAGIQSFNSGSGDPGEGAGTTHATLASGDIGGFVSGQDNPLNNPPSLLDPLTFANNGVSDVNYGGDLGTSSNNCNPANQDYYQVAKKLPGYVSGGCPNPIDNASLGYAAGIPPGVHIVCTATSSVTINGNITYNIAAGHASASNLPSFELVVEQPMVGGPANINIGTGVSLLAGTYIDEGGTINDTGGNTTGYLCPSGDTLNSNNTACGAIRLNIEGSFIANNLQLYRSYGTLSSGIACSTPGASDPACDQYDAEEFDYSPLNWLTPGVPNSFEVQAANGSAPVF